MKTALSVEQLAAYVARQVSSLFPDREVRGAELRRPVETALARLAQALGGMTDKYLPAGSERAFNHRNTDHYAMFLYLVSNSVFREGGTPELAEKAYALNKALHALDLYYEVALPDIFFFQHPVGTVLGRARYSNYFAVYQRCTIGGKDRVYPEIGEGVVMYGGSAIIGKCRIGNNVWLSTGTVVLQQDVPDNSVVFGQSPSLTIKPTRRDVCRDFFHESAPARP